MEFQRHHVTLASEACVNIFEKFEALSLAAIAGSGNQEECHHFQAPSKANVQAFHGNKHQKLQHRPNNVFK